MCVTVHRAWIARRAKLDQCLELQLFNRDCEQAETWMAAREQSLRDDQEGGSVDQLIKKHEDFDRAINSQEEKITALQNLAEHLVSNDHYDSPGIERRRDQVLDRYVYVCVCLCVCGANTSLALKLCSQVCSATKAKENFQNREHISLRSLTLNHRRQ